MKGKIIFSQMDPRGSLYQMIEANTVRFFLRFLVSKRVKVEDQTAGTHYFLGYLFNLIMRKSFSHKSES
jgi:hypothetical protein